MNEENRKYREIIERLRSIDDKIEALQSELSLAEKVAKRSIEIDGESFIKKEMDDTQRTLANVSKDINGTMIPSLQRKLKDK